MEYATLVLDYTTSITTDKIITTEYDSLVFLSAIGYKNNIDKLIYKINEENKYVDIILNKPDNSRQRISTYGKYKYITKKVPNSDYVHVILYKDSYVNNNHMYIYIYMNKNDSEEVLYDKIYENIDKLSPIPFLKEWTKPVISNLFYLNPLSDGYQAMDNLNVYYFSICNDSLKDEISYMLHEKTINIDGTNKQSPFLKNCQGLDSYLNIFGESLAEKIQNNFSPKFIPNIDKYDYHTNLCDDYIHNNGIELYEAQKAVAQSIVNNWKQNKNTLLVGECGVGKTIISSLAMFSHHANVRKGFNSIIMCPTHIVEKWKREIELAIPNSKAYIIHNLKELIDLKPKLINKYKTENTFVIVSKEVAKFGYNTKPAVIWSKKHKAFICPDCGKVLYKEIKETEEDIYGKKHKVTKKVNLTELDFLDIYTYNYKCNHCNTKLWEAYNKKDLNNKWIKLSKSGWMFKDHIISTRDKLLNSDKALDKKRRTILKDLIDQCNNVNENGEFIVTNNKANRKYPIAKYIKEKMKGVFDYGVQDEMHLLAAKDSIQGQAFHFILQACKRNVAMTGTLINGYADSIYYILYKMFPSVMKKSGFKYEDVNIFADKYGVTSYSYDARNTRKKKKMPGISPLIFTDYLFNNTVFISLKDMKNDLPSYTEIPIGVDMDEDVLMGYMEYENFMRDLFADANRNKDKKRSLKIVSSLIKDMMNYPDSPHCAKPLIDPDTGKIRFTPHTLDPMDRNKENELLNIVKEQVDKGEKVLIYYNAVNKTDIGSRLTNLLEENNFSAYELKASVKSEKRESIIKNLLDEGLDVLICNPSLVETGLDLIDFTTIVFYQVGYNLYTLRQASRRSWRLSQKNPVSVYYLYYNDSVQEKALALMATKLHAAKSVEGDFDEEGLKSMSENTDILSQIANNVVNDISCAIDTSLFTSTNYIKQVSNTVERKHVMLNEDISIPIDDNGMKIIINEWNKFDVNTKLDNKLINNPLKLFI